jgi:S-methylmethionine-dependent homocysteine/selenocysteine methylase
MKKLTLLDGGMGRELQDIGAPFSQPLWSAQALIESPKHVRQAHENFVAAGAEIIITNSYACVPFHLGEKRYQTDGARLAGQAAAIAQAVCQDSDKPLLVAGSIPPPFGSYRPDLFIPEQAVAIVADLINAQDPYVDLWLVETISSLKEFAVIQSVLKDSTKACYYAFSLSDTARIDDDAGNSDDDAGNNGQARLRSGETVRTATELVCKAGANAILFNCSVPEVMERAVIDAKQAIDHYSKSTGSIEIEIGVYANNFQPIKATHEANGMLQSTRHLTADDYLAYAKRWAKNGATIIGGCCGIGPSHIRALANWKAANTRD